jgi:hypothetical protein
VLGDGQHNHPDPDRICRPCPRCGPIERVRIVAHSLTVGFAETGDAIDRGELHRLADDVQRLLRWIDGARSAAYAQF